jgi:signal peptidase I
VVAPASRTASRFFLDYAQAATVALIFALFVRTYLFQVFKIPSASMEDTLLIGDHLVVNKFSLAPLASPFERAVLPMREVRRLDIVIFRYPHDPRQDYVKRVIGLPGDRLRIKENIVYIQARGEPGFTALDEPYVVHKYPDDLPDLLKNFGPIDIPDGHYFMMGDNRDDSLDSREWGLVPRANIVGRPVVIYWSFAGVNPDGALTLDTGSGRARPNRLVDAFTAVFRLTRWDRSGRMVR